MAAKRNTHKIDLPGIYIYQGKRTTTYYTIVDNKRINLGHDLRQAKRKLLEMDGEQPGDGETVADLLHDLMIVRKQMVAAGKLAQATYDTNIDEVQHLSKAFGQMDPTAVKPSHIWAYLHKYRGNESPIRANREIALLSTMFKRAMGAGIVDTNPCFGVERNEEISRDRLVTDLELRKFTRFCWRRSEAGKRVAMAAMIAYLTGKALGQILKLEISQITEDGILFGKRKRGAATLVSWSTRLHRYIAMSLGMPSTIKTPYVVHTHTGSAYSASGFKSIFQRLIVEWGKQGNERFTFHDLRAKAVTDMKDQGRKASELTGHRTEEIVNRVYDRRRIRKSAPVQ